VRRPAWLLAALGVLATLAACGSSHHAVAYSGRIYSVGEARRAFDQLGLALHGEKERSGLVTLQLSARHPFMTAGLGTVTVATRRAAVGRMLSLPGHVTRYANVTAFSKTTDLDEVRGALWALRWGTLSQGKPGRDRIVLGDSIGPIRLGESRKRLEKELGPGRSARGGLVRYLGGRVLVDYGFHDALYKGVMYLETRSSGFHTRSRVHVGSSRQALRSLYPTCENQECHVLQGPWPDALATVFRMKDGKVAAIDITYS
jgi:hypothetical protein